MKFYLKKTHECTNTEQETVDQIPFRIGSRVCMKQA